MSRTYCYTSQRLKDSSKLFYTRLQDSSEMAARNFERESTTLNKDGQTTKTLCSRDSGYHPKAVVLVTEKAANLPTQSQK